MFEQHTKKQIVHVSTLLTLHMIWITHKCAFQAIYALNTVISPGITLGFTQHMRATRVARTHCLQNPGGRFPGPWRAKRVPRASQTRNLVSPAWSFTGLRFCYLKCLFHLPDNTHRSGAMILEQCHPSRVPTRSRWTIYTIVPMTANKQNSVVQCPKVHCELPVLLFIAPEIAIWRKCKKKKSTSSIIIF